MSRAIIGVIFVAISLQSAHVSASPMQAKPTNQALTAPAVTVNTHAREYLWLVPERPHDARRIRLITGIFQSYTLIKINSFPWEMTISIQDPKTKIKRDFNLAFNTTLNGVPLKCERDTIIQEKSFCGVLPRDIIPGKTIIALLYWDKAFDDFPLLRGTDTMITVTH